MLTSYDAVMEKKELAECMKHLMAQKPKYYLDYPKREIEKVLEATTDEKMALLYNNNIKRITIGNTNINLFKNLLADAENFNREEKIESEKHLVTIYQMAARDFYLNGVNIRDILKNKKSEKMPNETREKIKKLYNDCVRNLNDTKISLKISRALIEDYKKFNKEECIKKLKEKIRLQKKIIEHSLFCNIVIKDTLKDKIG